MGAGPSRRPRTLCEAFQRTVAAHPDRAALTVAGDPASTLTWAQYGDRVRGVAAGLHARGLRRGDTLALLLPNGPDFHVVDAAALHLGAVPFSLYATSPPAQIAFQVRDAAARLVVCHPDSAESVRAAGVPARDLVVLGDGDVTLDDLETDGRGADLDFDAAWRAVEPDDLLTLIYTSGTTGPPKGVQISHRNEVAAAHAMHTAVGFPPGTRVVSYLPMAHVAERGNSHWFAMCFGFSVTCCPSPARVLEVLPEVRPSWFFGAPRTFEKLRAGIEASADSGLRAAIAQSLEQVRRDGAPSGDVPAEVVERTGLDQAVAVIVGGAPAPRHLIEFFHAIGVPLAELWGMSELCGSGTLNPRGAIRIGTVGRPVADTELRIAEDGEVQARSPGLTRGYLNRPDLTAEAITPDGWLRTGDIGSIDADGYLRLVDRKKELIINAAGKNMSPANIEAQLTSASPLIGQAVALGNGRPYNVALLVLDPDASAAFAREHGLEGWTLASLTRDAGVLAEIGAAVERANAQLSRVEGVKRFKLLADEWVAGGPELTPTMKLRRRTIEERYGPLVDELYA
jgi:long-subunit acyl-CoA synthetase (AMP-forming)